MTEMTNEQLPKLTEHAALAQAAQMTKELGTQGSPKAAQPRENA